MMPADKVGRWMWHPTVLPMFHRVAGSIPAPTTKPDAALGCSMAVIDNAMNRALRSAGKKLRDANRNAKLMRTHMRNAMPKRMRPQC